MIKTVAMLAALGLGAACALGQTTRKSRMLPSPPRQVMILTCNLEEAFSGEDVVDPADMQHFADRVREKCPVAPDMLLVSEVRGASAINVANFLTEVTGFHYEVAVKPGEKPEVSPGVVRDTAVILNADTMKAVDKGGHIETDVKGGKSKQHARLLAEEKEGGMKVAGVSVHLPAAKEDENASVSQIAKDLFAAYADEGAQDYVIAGDLSSSRVVDSGEGKFETSEGTPKKFWNTLTQSNGFVDSIFSKKKEEIDEAKRLGATRTDYVFVKGHVIDAASDLDYVTKRDDPGVFYSNHRFVWALVGLSQ
jgi:hypothetical protein